MGECSRPEPEQGLTARRDGRLTVVNRSLGLGSRRAGRTGEGSGSITCHPPRARDYVTSGRSRGHLSERASVSHHAASTSSALSSCPTEGRRARRDGLTSASFRRRMHLRLRGKEAGGGCLRTSRHRPLPSTTDVPYLSAGRRGPEPNFLAARFSLRRSLSVFCGFCFCCFFGLSELLLMGATNDRRFSRALGSENGRERRQPPRSP
jgi:hypothetical protein